MKVDGIFSIENKEGYTYLPELFVKYGVSPNEKDAIGLLKGSKISVFGIYRCDGSIITINQDVPRGSLYMDSFLLKRMLFDFGRKRGHKLICI